MPRPDNFEESRFYGKRLADMDRNELLDMIHFLAEEQKRRDERHRKDFEFMTDMARR